MRTTCEPGCTCHVVILLLLETGEEPGGRSGHEGAGPRLHGRSQFKASGSGADSFLSEYVLLFEFEPGLQGRFAGSTSAFLPCSFASTMA